jgi:hypothetical protein
MLKINYLSRSNQQFSATVQPAALIYVIQRVALPAIRDGLTAPHATSYPENQTPVKVRLV